MCVRPGSGWLLAFSSETRKVNVARGARVLSMNINWRLISVRQSLVINLQIHNAHTITQRMRLTMNAITAYSNLLLYIAQCASRSADGTTLNSPKANYNWELVLRAEFD